MRACPRERSQFEGRLDDFTNHMLDGEMQLLDSRRLVGRNHETLVDQLARGAAALAEQRHHPHALGSRRLRGPHDAWALATRGMQHHEITGAGPRFALAREDLVEAEVV